MKLSKILISIMIAISFFNTAGMTVHPTLVDVVVGNGTPASCTENALNQAVDKTGNISFNCGNNLVTISLTSQKTLSGVTILDGGGKITLDANHMDRIFTTATGSNIFISNITLQNGNVPDRGDQDGNGQGGAILANMWSDIHINNVIFKNNIALSQDSCGGGGAIRLRGFDSAIISGSQFIGNQAKNGGAINNLTSDLTISNTIFDSNISYRGIDQIGDSCGGGGAIFIDGADYNAQAMINIIGDKFQNNVTNNNGGAIFAHLYSQEKMNIHSSSFEGNKASFVSQLIDENTWSGNGGAIWFDGENVDSGRLFINKIIFSDSTINNNHADYKGGGVYAWDAPIELSNVTIDGNEAKNTLSPKPLYLKGIGGGLALGSSSTPIFPSKLTHVTISNNSAGYTGGGISTIGNLAQTGTTTLVNSIIAYNKTLRVVQNITIDNNCNELLMNLGGSIQYPSKSNNISGADHDCASSIKIADPLLGPLQDNGGLTKTEALQAGSPAINYGLKAYCTATDQRGYIRPGTCDSGAYAYGGHPFVPSAWVYLPLARR